MQQRFFLEDGIAMVRPDQGLNRLAERSDAEEWPVAWAQLAEAEGFDGPEDCIQPTEDQDFAEVEVEVPKRKPKTKASKK